MTREASNTTDRLLGRSIEDTPLPDEKVKSLRRELLENAANTVDGQRDREYGGPEQSFDSIARLWTVIKGVPFTPADVALMMAALKLARLAATRGTHVDSWVDLAGYAACGYEVISQQRDSGVES